MSYSTKWEQDLRKDNLEKSQNPNDKENNTPNSSANNSILLNERMKNLQSFSTELNPIIEQLNILIKKYNIYPIDDIIILKAHKNEIVPFIHLESFPVSSLNHHSIDL